MGSNCTTTHVFGAVWVSSVGVGDERLDGRRSEALVGVDGRHRLIALQHAVQVRRSRRRSREGGQTCNCAADQHGPSNERTHVLLLTEV